MNDKSEAYLPLMTGDEDTPSNKTHWQGDAESHKKCFSSMKDAVFLGIILLQSMALILLSLSFRRTISTETNQPEATGSNSQIRLYSPANSILEDQIKVFSNGFAKTTLYQEYSDEADKAWLDLYEPTRMRILKSEAALLPNKTWPIKEMPGYYIAELDVFHQLRCVDKLRQALRRDRYDKNFKNPDMAFSTQHVTHCLDQLRQYVMCHSDTAVAFWQWDAKKSIVKGSFDYPHQCTNFEKLRDWVRDRQLDHYIDVHAYIEDDIPPPAVIY